MDAIPLIRQFAKTGDGEVRDFAIEWLGDFGHPDDYEFLVSGLKTPNRDLLAAHVRGLTTYDDLRAVPALIKLLELKSHKVRTLAIDALQRLVTIEALDALRRHASDAKNSKEAEECRKFTEGVVALMKLDWEAYAAKSPDERAALLIQIDKREERFRPKEGDRELTHKEFVKAAREWKKQHTIKGGKYQWVEDGHVLAATTPEDISLLLDVRAAVYTRLSDECLYEVETLNELVRRLARSQYREVVGICPKVEPKTGTPEQGKPGGKGSGQTASSQPSPQDH